MRAICNEFYGTEGIHGCGYGQDEDQGQLGAWYVMSAIGLFDVKGLTQLDPEFQIGSPLFDKTTIKLNRNYYKGKTFTIKTWDNSAANQYIQSVRSKGKQKNVLFIPFREVVKGGEMVITLGNEPTFLPRWAC